MTAFLIAPVALLRYGKPFSDDDLGRMSEVGQAYGGLSALLSGAATAAVATALLLQIRQLRLSQVQGIRMIQIELMRMLIDNPELRPISPTFGDVTQEQRLRDIYTNLMIKNMQMGYEIGYFRGESVTKDMRSQFAVDDIRAFWERTRSIRYSSARDKIHRDFNRLVDEAYEQAVVDRPKPPAAPDQLPTLAVPSSPSNSRRLPSVFGVGLAVAAAGYGVWRACRRGL